MGLFSGERKKDESICVIDIGSSTVTLTVALVSHTKSTITILPKIIFQSVHEIKVSENIDFNNFLSLTLKALKDCLSDFSKAHIRNVRSHTIFFASPWYVSEIKKLKVEKEKPFIFTKKMLKELVESELAYMRKTKVTKYPEFGTTAHIIESEVTQILLNGYELADPFNKKTRIVEITVSIAAVPKEILTAITDIVEPFFPPKKVIFHTFIQSAFSVLRDILTSQSDFIIVAVGGEVTDIAIVKGGAITAETSFSYGENFVIHKIMSILHVPEAEARSLFSLHKQKMLEEGKVHVLETILQKAESEWVASLEKSLISVATGFLLPDTIALIVSPRAATWLTQAVESESFAQYTLTEKKFNAILVDEAMMHGYITNTLSLPIDSYTSLETLFVKKIIKYI